MKSAPSSSACLTALRQVAKSGALPQCGSTPMRMGRVMSGLLVGSEWAWAGLGDGAVPPVGGQGRASDQGGLAVSSVIDPACRCWFCTISSEIETCAVVGAFDGQSVA